MEFITNNILLVAVAVVSGALLLWPMLPRGGGSGPRVGTLEATRLINSSDAIVLDVRERAEFDAGHVLGAKSAPLSILEKGTSDFAKFRNRTVIVHCADGRRASRAADLLRKDGFSNVVQLTGGFAAWREAGLPVEK